MTDNDRPRIDIVDVINRVMKHKNINDNNHENTKHYRRKQMNTFINNKNSYQKNDNVSTKIMTMIIQHRLLSPQPLE